MNLYLDTADLDAIKRLYDYLPLEGVTTNPSILAASGRAPFEVLKEIRDFIGDDELYVQVIASDAEGMIADSERIRAELGENTFTKVPVTKEGLKAIKAISDAGHGVLGTAVYNTMQAWLAGKAGARWVAPYVNRIDNMEQDGCAMAMDMHDLFRANDMSCDVLGASFKNLRQVLELVRYGVGGCTVAPAVIEAALDRVYVTDAVRVFEKDFAELVGEGKTLTDL